MGPDFRLKQPRTWPAEVRVRRGFLAFRRGRRSLFLEFIGDKSVFLPLCPLNILRLGRLGAMMRKGREAACLQRSDQRAPQQGFSESIAAATFEQPSELRCLFLPGALHTPTLGTVPCAAHCACIHFLTPERVSSESSSAWQLAGVCRGDRGSAGVCVRARSCVLWRLKLTRDATLVLCETTF